MREMTEALTIPWTALIRERTAIFSPSFLEIILSGLNTLSILMTLMNWMFRELNDNERIYDTSSKINFLQKRRQ